MDFAEDFEFNPYMLRGGGDDTQDYVVRATRFSIFLNIFLQLFACLTPLSPRCNT
jgi:hypothetical protein